MKRKRGHSKGKSKKAKVISKQEKSKESAENTESQNSQNSSDVAAEHDNSEHESRVHVDAPSSTGSDHSHNVSIDPDVSADNTTAKSIGRVKVKLKTSKAPEPDTVKNNPQERSGLSAEKKEEGIPPLPERKPVFVGNVYRKTKGIKIKSSKAVASSSSSIENTDVKTQNEDALQTDLKTSNENSEANKQKVERTPTPPHKEQKKTDQTSLYNVQKPESAVICVDKEQKKTDQSSPYKKQELEDSLKVIKKIMKMEAAEPFNIPVNPEALGIPDYFDIIHTPMDFGTICKNLEKGGKYMNSEEVYKDVQYIWNNCCKYNKKGDYIVDLMRRVKKNFMKYWTASGLYTEQSAENAQLEDGTQSSHGKGSTKSSSKQKSHKRHGRHHKSDCMCAICIMKRRKREREQSTRTSQGLSGTQEESSPVASLSVSSLNMGEEQDLDIDVENRSGGRTSETMQMDSPMQAKLKVIAPKEDEAADEDEEEEEHEMEIEKEIEDDDDRDKTAEEAGGQIVGGEAQKSDVIVLSEGRNSTKHEKEDKAIQLQRQKEVQCKEWRRKMTEKFRIENPQLLSVCEALFPDENRNTVWTGPHSLFNRKGSTHRANSLHKAIESFMK